MSVTFFNAQNMSQMCSECAERRAAMPRTESAAMARAMGKMSACTRIVKAGVVTPASLFVIALVSIVVLVGNVLSVVSLISLLLTGLTGLVGLARLVRLETEIAMSTAMGD